MKAKWNGIKMNGKPEEIAELIRLVEANTFTEVNPSVYIEPQVMLFDSEVIHSFIQEADKINFESSIFNLKNSGAKLT